MNFKFKILFAILAFLALPFQGHCKHLSETHIPVNPTIQQVKTGIYPHSVLLSINKNHSDTYKAIDRPTNNRNPDFLLCIILLFAFGIIRTVHPGYIKQNFRAFKNPTLSNRNIRNQLQQNLIPKLLWDLFFLYSASLFIYQTIRYNHYDKWMQGFEPLTIITGIAIVICLIYLIRFALLKMSGWVFQIRETMDHYAFLIFLFNRTLGILLIPFTIIITLGLGLWVQIAFLIALGMCLGIYIYRFICARKILGYFLRFSKFHFILYLCASEILPLAILIKLISLRFSG